ncbi:hypothetical protein [Brenneria tiliae]|uniref:hypothetical protein n=1 Tax=Brenneria tiliae TaxID=2914984 RepID=UPI00201493D0|nr:hypothetical protein [Brenneria tiliae]MCL2899850.1 hypothetical protein [Brenneria tiliae]MCL2904661.1 hypothetical protein [Brenneria tiliae]
MATKRKITAAVTPAGVSSAHSAGRRRVLSPSDIANSKPVKMTSQELLEVFVAAAPALDGFPKAPKGEAAGRKVSVPPSEAT